MKTNQSYLFSDFEFYNILYTDYTTLNILTYCQSLNFVTNICDKSAITVQTRQRPSQLSGAQRQAINEQIDFVLVKYCLSSEQLTYSIVNDSVPECDPVEPESIAPLIQLLAKYF